MKQAFAILFHKNFEQLNILLTQLDVENVDIYLHVDKKIKFTGKEVINTKNANIKYISNRVDIQWAGFSMVEAQRQVYQEIFDSGIYYDFIHLISGQDLLIKPLAKLTEFLQIHGQKQYVAYWASPASIYYQNGENLDLSPEKENTKSTARIMKVWGYAVVGSLPGHQLVFKKRKQVNVRIKKGAQWMSVTGECLAYIINFLNENETFFESFRDSMCSDEMLFQTIIWYSPFKSQVFNTRLGSLSSVNHLRRTRWIFKPENFLDMPNTYKNTATDRLFLSNTPAFIARKFDLEKDAEIIHFITSELSSGNIVSKKELKPSNKFQSAIFNFFENENDHRKISFKKDSD